MKKIYTKFLTIAFIAFAFGTALWILPETAKMDKTQIGRDQMPKDDDFRNYLVFTFGQFTTPDKASVLTSLGVADYKAITWLKVTNSVTEGGRLKKSLNNSGFDAGASSYEKITGDGSLRYLTTSGDDRFFGLSGSDTNTNFTSINYCFSLAAGNVLQVWENGVQKGGSYGTWNTVGTILEIKRVGTTVTYWRNGVLVYTSLTASSGDLIADTTIYYFNQTFEYMEMKNG